MTAHVVRLAARVVRLTAHVARLTASVQTVHDLAEGLLVERAEPLVDEQVPISVPPASAVTTGARASFAWR
ncbi:hypothetical protein ACFQY7_15670 [Actinomadura luteofluorescens]|uniref:Uncharacterized protein n=1 Tax=Actinomadura luteofluorescens TaxID=46163 RepID=A0A7Y9JK99_9ACTN|nr:hypothetical protein [Actinomadura luteofluorescens]NYD52120.1 hypothetical protein [Actinomadura luteofluorescens]